MLWLAAASSALPAQAPEGRFRLDQPPIQGALAIGTAPAGTVTLSLDGREIPQASDGRFLIGFDRDAGPAARLTARFADGSELVEPLGIARRAWRIESINLPRPAGGPTPEFQRMREGELARIGAARNRRSAASG